jgi:hypothetical protein
VAMDLRDQAGELWPRAKVNNPEKVMPPLPHSTWSQQGDVRDSPMGWFEAEDRLLENRLIETMTGFHFPPHK